MESKNMLYITGSKMIYSVKCFLESINVINSFVLIFHIIRKFPTVPLKFEKIFVKCRLQTYITRLKFTTNKLRTSFDTVNKR